MPWETTREGERARGKMLRLIRDYHDAHGYAPSFRDLGDGVRLSPGTVTYHLQRLQLAGLVAWDEGIARSLRLTDAGRELATLALETIIRELPRREAEARKAREERERVEREARDAAMWARVRAAVAGEARQSGPPT
ncbi:MAG TPA: winged helix-turn-helix transcriptional regulator [Oscillatoriaceae cyanobacterium]